MTELISILVPIYGVEKYIERCSRSLFGQTYFNIEYIFVDDCTKDNSIGILKNDLIYILLETDGQKKNMLFQQIYEDISKNLVPIRPDRHYTRTKGQLAGKYSNTHKRAY